jgi:hypothetical protein
MQVTSSEDFFWIPTIVRNAAAESAAGPGCKMKTVISITHLKHLLELKIYQACL